MAGLSPKGSDVTVLRNLLPPVGAITVTTLSANPANSSYLQTVAFTAVVTLQVGSGSPTGTVDFSDSLDAPRFARAFHSSLTPAVTEARPLVYIRI